MGKTKTTQNLILCLFYMRLDSKAASIHFNCFLFPFFFLQAWWEHGQGRKLRFL